jgi:CheY-like chemotaxis protein
VTASPDPADGLADFAGLQTLLVEDNARLRGVMQHSLEMLGCRVATAADATEALARLDATPALRLLVSDVRMPGSLDGIALAQRATTRQPALRALLLTGYAAQPVPGFAVLYKPFTLEELSQAIAAVLRPTAGATPPGAG